MDEKIEVGRQLKILVLEDSLRDFEIVSEQLTEAGLILHISRVEKEKEYASAIRRTKYEVILSDFKLPGFDAFAALDLRNTLCPEVPFICVSGSIGEMRAIELLKAGAVDYILKDRLERLPFAIKRALADAKDKEVRRQMESSLQEKMSELQRFHDLSVGREMKMIELKKEVNGLLKKAGLREKYRIVG